MSLSAWRVRPAAVYICWGICVRYSAHIACGASVRQEQYLLCMQRHSARLPLCACYGVGYGNTTPDMPAKLITLADLHKVQPRLPVVCISALSRCGCAALPTLS